MPYMHMSYTHLFCIHIPLPTYLISTFFFAHLFRTHIFYEHVVEGTIASKLSLVPGFQLPPAGSYIAIRGLKEGRWLKIEGCQVGHSWGGNDNLADEARAERFKLVESWKHL